jgi:D-glycero-alpha-D-manno-heptose-7-phosphate kinase
VNIAVNPGVKVSIRATADPDPVILAVDTFGDRYPIVPGAPRTARHALLEAAVDALPPPGGLNVEVAIRSAVPAGSGTGTSAAVAVALVAALSAWRGEQRSPREIAYAAHRIEVGALGRQSGIQDQLSAAFGGVNYLEVDPYPEARVYPLPAWPGLGRRLSLVFLGRAHVSSDVHRQVIEELEGRGSEALERLRDAAMAARDAVIAKDLVAFGQAMIVNNEAQRLLHRALVGVDASRLIDLASAQGAMGWKVNGAGGDGGSVTILSADQEARAVLERRIAATDPQWRVLPLWISTQGLTVEGAVSR